MEREQGNSSGEAISGQKVRGNHAPLFRRSVSDVCGPSVLTPCGHLHVCRCGSGNARSLWHALAGLSWIIPGTSEVGVHLSRSNGAIELPKLEFIYLAPTV